MNASDLLSFSHRTSQRRTSEKHDGVSGAGRKRCPGSDIDAAPQCSPSTKRVPSKHQGLWQSGATLQPVVPLGALRNPGLWQSEPPRRCVDWGCGNFRLRRVAWIGVMAIEARRQQGVLLGALRLWGLWQADSCHNPNSRNARDAEIATTPDYATDREGRRAWALLGDCHDPRSRNARGREPGWSIPPIATTPNYATCREGRRAGILPETAKTPILVTRGEKRSVGGLLRLLQPPVR